MKKILILAILGFMQTIVAMEEVAVLSKEELNIVLFSSIRNKRPVDEIFALLEQGADVNAQGKSEQIPLHVAAACGHLEASALLIDKGVAIDSKDDEGRTPLHYASRMRHCC